MRHHAADNQFHNSLCPKQSVANPSEDTTLFVNKLNALIDGTSALYNQRIAAAKAAKKPEGNNQPEIPK